MKKNGFTVLELVVVASIVAIVIATIMGAIIGSELRKRFMAQCKADGKKEYECEVLYKQSHPDPNVVYIVH